MVKESGMQLFATVALSSSLAVALATSASAQTSGGTFTLDRSSMTSVREYVAAEAVPRQLTLPPNLVVSREYQSIVETMLHQSPTFRRQCVRIAGEPFVSVEVRLARPPWRLDARALTQIRRRDSGFLDAIIEIFPLQDSVELIAHELEHVIEQLDGVDLESRARLRDASVRVLLSHSRAFETVRARKVGLRVGTEVRR